MATERQAKRARDKHQKKLIKSGIHALSVEPLPESLKKEGQPFGVVAWVHDKPRKPLPPALSIKERGKTVKVPLVVRESKPFQLE